MGPPWQGTRQPRKDSQNNVEKILLAAGADSNRQRLQEPGYGQSRGEVTGLAHESVTSDEEGVTPSEETVHVSAMEVTPTLRKGTLGTWWFRRSAGWLDTVPTLNLTYETELGFGQTTEVGAYANRRLNLTKRGRPKEERPRLRTGPEKLGRPGL